MCKHLQASYFAPSHQHVDWEPVCTLQSEKLWGPWPAAWERCSELRWGELWMIQPCSCSWILFFTCFPRAEQATTLCWTTAQMGADSNISNHWGSPTANRPLGNPWLIICSSHSMLISSPLGEGSKANNAVSLSTETFVGEKSKSDWSKAQNLWSALSYSQMKYACFQLNPLSFSSECIYIDVSKKTVTDTTITKT